MPLVTKHNVSLNLRIATVTLHFYQQWSEWLKYNEYKWHNFDFIEVSLVDNYPFHGRFDVEMTFGLLGFNVVVEIESNKEPSEGSPLAEARELLDAFDRSEMHTRILTEDEGTS